jgi:tRNA modification GTPase
MPKWYRFESEMIEQSTIYALSSGQGRAGIAVIRISGPAAGKVLIQLCGELPKPRFASLRNLKSDDEFIDQALVLWLPGPNTVTGEDIAEFHVHGSPSVVAKLFSEFSIFKNVAPAEAGAFTRRAFENGRMDLVKVEGLADLLGSQTESQRRLAMRQFMGEASAVYENWRGQLTAALAMLEAAIDFVDEDDVVQDAWNHVKPNVEKLCGELLHAVELSAKAGAVRDGLKLVIAGPPNAGKSSLMNWLVGREAAIVSPIAGTTRDVVERVIDFHGAQLLVSDTAGIRADTSDVIEAVGIDRAKIEVRDADILVWVTAPDVIAEVGPERTPDVIVYNKGDLDSSRVRNDESIVVSIKYGQGLNLLAEVLKNLIQARSSVANNAIVVRDRHVAAVKETIRLLNDSLEDEKRPLELIAEDLRKATRAISSITGRIDVEDLLGKIFSEFCIGK